MAGAERLCHSFEGGLELMSYFRMGSRDEKGWEPLFYRNKRNGNGKAVTQTLNENKLAICLVLKHLVFLEFGL